MMDLDSFGIQIARQVVELRQAEVAVRRILDYLAFRRDTVSTPRRPRRGNRCFPIVYDKIAAQILGHSTATTTLSMYEHSMPGYNQKLRAEVVKKREPRKSASRKQCILQN